MASEASALHRQAGHMTAIAKESSCHKALAKRGRSLIASPMSMVFLLPLRVTVLSAVEIIRRNIWFEARALQGPQRAGV